jgi:hypothetical protein
MWLKVQMNKSRAKKNPARGGAFSFRLNHVPFGILAKGRLVFFPHFPKAALFGATVGTAKRALICCYRIPVQEKAASPFDGKGGVHDLQ